MYLLRVAWRILLFAVILCLTFPGVSARAQDEGLALAEIATPDTTKFPLITTYLDPFDSQGNFLANLEVVDVAVLENGGQIAPDALEGQATPLNFILAINSDPALAIRDGQGFSRYDKLLESLGSWAGERPTDSADKLALVWNGGVIATGLSPAEWKSRLEAFDPNPRNSTSGLAALAFALDAAQQAQSSPGGKKSILLISPHLSLKDQGGLNDLTSRAKQAGVRVYVWITDSQSFLDNPGTQALQNLALVTSGREATFTGSESLPELEEWFAPLRNVYKLSYTSKIREAGTHSLSVQVSKDGLALTSPAVSFPIDIQPPSAALLSPPITITRENPESPFDLQSFEPREEEILVLVEFPDGRERALVRSALYIDGQKAAEKTAEPFTSFTWDLSGYLVSEEHTLQVEVEDTLGLSRMSADVPVQVIVVQPPGGMAGLILRNRAAVTITFMVLAGAVMLGIIILGGRRGLASLAERRKARAAKSDPVTQPVKVKVEAARANPFPWLRRKQAPPPAYFVRLATDGTPLKDDPIGLSGREITLGTDPTQATVVLDHPSLSLLHARLRHAEDGGFTLLDENSIAGTWVNYELIPKEGCLLRHGDMIHFGLLTYRFVLAKPPATPKATITPIKDG